MFVVKLVFKEVVNFVYIYFLVSIVVFVINGDSKVKKEMVLVVEVN